MNNVNATLFHRDGHTLLDGKGGVVYVNPSAVGLSIDLRSSDYFSYAKSISIIVKNHLRNELSNAKWSYIYAYDGVIFIPIVNSNVRSSAFIGKNSPYEDVLENIVLSMPISSRWVTIIPENFGRVEFSCGYLVTDVSYQFPDSSYSVTSRQSHFPSLLYHFKRGAKIYDSAFHLATAFKIFLAASLNRSFSRDEWNKYAILELVDKLYCLGSSYYLEIIYKIGG